MFNIIKYIMTFIIDFISYIYYLFVSKKNITNYIKNNILNIKKTNIELYYNDKLERKLFKMKNITNKDILFVYNYLNNKHFC